MTSVIEKFIAKSDSPNAYNRLVEKVRHFIVERKIVALPTDTVHGLCRAADSESERLNSIKRRDARKPLGIFVADFGDLHKYAMNVPPKELLAQLWPGALTLFLKSTKYTKNFLNNGSDVVGIRIPQNQFILDILQPLKGFALAQTSANVTGEASPKSIDDFSKLHADIDLIIDGGDLDSNISSTIIDMTENGLYEVKRRGKNDLKYCQLLEQFGYQLKKPPAMPSFQFIADKSLTSEFEQFAIGVINDEKQTSDILKIIAQNEKCTLPQNVCRIAKFEGKNHILLCRAKDFLQNIQDKFHGLFSITYEKDIMIDIPKTEAEYRIANNQWKTAKPNFTNLIELSEKDQEIHLARMGTLLEKVNCDRLSNYGMICSGKTNEILVNASCQSNPDNFSDNLGIQHCSIKLINDLSKTHLNHVKMPQENNSKRSLFENDDNNEYLATGCDVYLFREPCLMCAAALLHGRAARIFFAECDSKSGALVSAMQIQYLDGINHRFKVFQYLCE